MVRRAKNADVRREEMINRGTRGVWLHYPSENTRQVDRVVSFGTCPGHPRGAECLGPTRLCLGVVKNYLLYFFIVH